MRLIAAGLVGFAVFFAGMYLLYTVAPNVSAAVAAVVVLGALSTGVLAGRRVAHLGAWRPLGASSRVPSIAELEAAGMVTAEEFRATRALGVAQTEDEGPTYLLELDDRRILCLAGQYLFEYEPITDDSELNQSRRFPCSEFTVRRHATKGFVLDIDCRGGAFEPMETLPPFPSAVLAAGRHPTDGQLLVGVSLDDLRASGGGVPVGARAG